MVGREVTVHHLGVLTVFRDEMDVLRWQRHQAQHANDGGGGGQTPRDGGPAHSVIIRGLSRKGQMK